MGKDAMLKAYNIADLRELARKRLPKGLFEFIDRGTEDEVSLANNRAIFERSQLDRNVAGMGTTLTAALVEGERVRLAHVGDSRAYLFREGELHRLTEDHTLVHRMVREGEISEAEAETHPHRSILTQVWGPADADHTEYLRVYIRQLRMKLEADPQRPEYILTEPGVGYRFLADE